MKREQYIASLVERFNTLPPERRSAVAAEAKHFLDGLNSNDSPSALLTSVLTVLSALPTSPETTLETVKARTAQSTIFMGGEKF